MTSAPQRCARKAHVQVAKDERRVEHAEKRPWCSSPRQPPRRRAVRRFVLVINAEAAAKGNGASPFYLRINKKKINKKSPSSERTCRANLVSCLIDCKKHVRDQNAIEGEKKKYFPSNLKDICLSSAAAAAAAAAQAARPGRNFSCAGAPPQILTFPICCFCTTANV